jgi:hypothetical protein
MGRKTDAITTTIAQGSALCDMANGGIGGHQISRCGPTKADGKIASNGASVQPARLIVNQEEGCPG